MRDRILETAEKLFWRYGVKSVTMDDMARELGISKKTIYQHFADKDAIINEVVGMELSCERSDISQLEIEAQNPVDEMLQASRYLSKELASMNPVLLYDLKKYYPKAWNLFQAHKQQHMMKSIRRNLEQGIALELYRPDLNVEILSRLRLEQVEMAFDPSIFPPSRFSMIDVQMEFLHHFLRGLLTEKGFQLYNHYLEQSAIEPNNP
ncbi:AcrR family transcriptional regulator [Rhabdobacter roseus]|uniref:AcrR family transcriptional regulator n=1 Tax=Rhabdobacter roseus TaxID=1655419 RepID=A0A840TPK4_9BACT|nr:AcrR family transcriptional regulator [Rhabdobacter roseus]